MILVLLIILSHWGVDADDPLILKGLQNGFFGKWQDWATCPGGEYVHGMQIKYQEHQGDKDDTALNAVKLYCQNIGEDDFRTDHSIMSGEEGQYGGWQGIKWCPKGTVGIGYAFRWESLQHNKDDVAADNFRLYCGTVDGEKNPNSYKEGDTVGFGEWTADRFCPEEYVVCGIVAQMEYSQGKGDDTSLNNVHMQCCHVPAIECEPEFKFDILKTFDNGGPGTMEVKYTKKISATKTSGTTHMVSQREIKSIIRKVSDTVNARGGIEVPLSEVSASNRDELTTGKEKIRADELITMIQKVTTKEQSEEVKYTVPALTFLRIEQLYVICGNIKIGLEKTVIHSNSAVPKFTIMFIFALWALLVTLY